MDGGSGAARALAERRRRKAGGRAGGRASRGGRGEVATAAVTVLFSRFVFFPWCFHVLFILSLRIFLLFFAIRVFIIYFKNLFFVVLGL